VRWEGVGGKECGGRGRRKGAGRGEKARVRG
jgi:hypothetical protein